MSRYEEPSREPEVCTHLSEYNFDQNVRRMCKSYSSIDCISNALKCQLNIPCRVKYQYEESKTASSCHGLTEGSCLENNICEWLNPSKSKPCSYQPQYSSDLYGVVKKCNAISNHDDCLNEKVPGSECMNFKHYGKCEGSETGQVISQHNDYSEDQCLAECKSESTCKNVEY